MLSGLDQAVWDLVTTRPVTAAAVIAAALSVIHLVRRARRSMPVTTSPRRAFSAGERREGLTRSGGRCEHKNPLWRRCPQAAEHADHIYPWSKGGWTAVSNLQMLCQRHNLAKGARTPSRLYLWRLHRRRRRYLPPGVTGRVQPRPPRTR